MVTILKSVVRPLSAEDSRDCHGEWGGGRVQAIHHHHTVEILRGIVLYTFYFKINVLLCYIVVSVFVSLEANIMGYWILGILFGIVLTLFYISKNSEIKMQQKYNILQ